MVSGISHGMILAFRQKGVPLAKEVLLPNWLRLPVESIPELKGRAEARQMFGIADRTLLAVYSGNLGKKQSLEILIEAAALLQSLPRADAAKVKIIIAGDGAARPDLERCLLAHPGVRVQLLPLLSDEHYGDLLTAADVALITQSPGTGQFFFPSKLLSVLVAGLPVVAVADEDSELSQAVRIGGFGRTVEPGDALGLAAVLRSLSESDSQLESWARRTEWVRQFSREIILPRFQQMLVTAAELPNQGPRAEPLPTVDTVPSRLTNAPFPG
jgi:colanic acid biosynthesis glycosyl transferase WcaI